MLFANGRLAAVVRVCVLWRVNKNTSPNVYPKLRRAGFSRGPRSSAWRYEGIYARYDIYMSRDTLPQRVVQFSSNTCRVGSVPLDSVLPSGQSAARTRRRTALSYRSVSGVVWNNPQFARWPCVNFGSALKLRPFGVVGPMVLRRTTAEMTRLPSNLEPSTCLSPTAVR
jgi:hypothetical protein